ncbi:MAG: hypothetical protein JSV80_16910 [Acidobacteriota bacterium]|nr:MAG: hypothetical protein JSV80_16910 [Acidobacteriota bacterium]
MRFGTKPGVGPQRPGIGFSSILSGPSRAARIAFTRKDSQAIRERKPPRSRRGRAQGCRADRISSSFAGKYKSLFLPNTGSREERMEALRDAIAEIYAYAFGPDPIEYRAERGLLDIHDEMAVMIQDVIGCRVGNYFLMRKPASSSPSIP